MPPANRSRPIWVASVALFTLVVMSVVALNGCGGRPTEVSGGGREERAKDDPWQKFVGGFRGEADWQKVRQLLTDLNSGLSDSTTTATRPRTAEPAELDKLKADLRLTDRETKFVAQSDYTQLDAHYLAECLYLRDAAAGLGVQDSDPVPVRAGAAFDWVRRQVVNFPSVFQTPEGVFTQPPVPPAYVLRRGSGTGTERAFVFLALCRQLGLDACLVGTAAADRDWTYTRTKAGNMPDGPFWAVAVKSGDDLLLYSPWRGEAFPGKTADRPATLAELKADPAVVANWKDDKTAPWDVPDADVKAAELYVSVPLSAVAPRTATLHDKLTGTVGGSYRVNWAETTARLAAGGHKVSGWNPPADVFTPVRGLGSFLPTQQGGLEMPPDVKQFYVYYQRAQTSQPALTLNLPDLKHPAVSQKLLDIARGFLILSYLPQLAQPDSVVWPPLEKIHRGRHNDATKELIDLRDKFTEAVKNRAGAALAKGDDTATWVAKANELYDNLSRARVSEYKAVEVPAAERQIEEFWKASQQKAGFLLNEIAGAPGAAEATFLLAKSFHERAEKAELEVKRAAGGDASAARVKAKAAWATAASWWGQYDRYRELQNQSYPGRGDLTKKLAERADKLAK